MSENKSGVMIVHLTKMSEEGEIEYRNLHLHHEIIGRKRKQKEQCEVVLVDREKFRIED